MEVRYIAVKVIFATAAFVLLSVSSAPAYAAPSPAGSQAPSPTPSPTPSPEPSPCETPSAKIFFEPAGVTKSDITRGRSFGSWFRADKSFEAKDVDGAVEYLIDKLDADGNDVLNRADLAVSEDSENEACPFFDIRIIGYSHGGTGALKLSHVLSKQAGSSVYRIAVGTIDPVRAGYGFNARRYYKKASRVFALMNVYQRNGDNGNEMNLAIMEYVEELSVLKSIYMGLKIRFLNVFEDSITQLGKSVPGSRPNKNLTSVSFKDYNGDPFYYIDHHVILFAYPEEFRRYIFGKGEAPRSLPKIRARDDAFEAEDQIEMIGRLGLSKSLWRHSLKIDEL